MVKLVKPKVRVFRRWFKKLLVAFLAFGFLVGIFYLVFKSDFLVIKHINCQVKDKTSIADEKRWCEAVKREVLGQRIFLLKRQAIASEIKRKFLPVGEVVFKKKYPQTVLVQIVERKPMARICPPGGLEFLIDKEGVVYSEVQSEFQGLRVVTLELGTELALGQKIDDDAVSLILLEEPQVSSIKYSAQQGIEVKSDEQLKIYFSREKNLESQIRSLQLILKKYKIEGKDLKQVDLRFDHPVVRY